MDASGWNRTLAITQGTLPQQSLRWGQEIFIFNTHFRPFWCKLPLIHRVWEIPVEGNPSRGWYWKNRLPPQAGVMLFQGGPYSWGPSATRQKAWTFIICQVRVYTWHHSRHQENNKDASFLSGSSKDSINFHTRSCIFIQGKKATWISHDSLFLKMHKRSSIYFSQNESRIFT